MEISIARSSAVSSQGSTLLVALELSKASWLVAISVPFSSEWISHHSIAGGDTAALLDLIGKARSRTEAALGRQASQH
jgi:transposase